MLLEDKKAAPEMQAYNQATHSYGLLDIKNNIKLLTSFLQCQKEEISKHLEACGAPPTMQQDAPMDTDAPTSEGKIEKEA